jgi:HK97 gp10 family phage protein
VGAGKIEDTALATTVSFKVTGAAEIERAMKELGVQAANRIARSALNRAANPVVQKARELAPTKGDPDDPYATGLLKRSITKRLRRQRRGSPIQTVIVGVEKPASRYAHFAEFGTVHQRAKAYLRPALDAEAQNVLNVMQEGMRAGVEREIKSQAPVQDAPVISTRNARGLPGGIG